MSDISRRNFINMATGLPGLMTANSLFSYNNPPIHRNSSTLNPSETYMESLRVAAISTRSHEGKPEKNMEHIASWVAKASEKDPALVCFPELNVSGYVYGRKIWEAAEPVPGPSTVKLEALAKQYKLIIAAGIAEMDKGIVYDTYVLVGPDGYIGKSRKMHIPIPEVGSWRGGGVPPVIDIGIAKVGVNICFDNWLPESARLVALQGAEIILAPFVWGGGKLGNPPDHAGRNRKQKDYSNRTLPSRAIDNGVFLIFVNDCGMATSGEYREATILIYSPEGLLIAESPDDADGEVMVIADLDRKILVERRSQGHFHPRFRRPELYKILAEGDIGHQNPQ